MPEPPADSAGPVAANPSFEVQLQLPKSLEGRKRIIDVDLTRSGWYVPRLDDELISGPMRGEVGIAFEGERVLFGGVSYVPLSVASAKAQTTEKNLRDWIKKQVAFNGKLIQTTTIPFTGRKLYVSEDSVRRMAERFVRWPSNEPAGAILLGSTKDKTGYISTPEAAALLGISARTMWLWASRGNAPIHKPLDVIRCTTSDHFYIREDNVRELKRLLPRAGVHRGRRPQQALRL